MSLKRPFRPRRELSAPLRVVEQTPCRRCELALARPVDNLGEAEL